MRVVRSVGVLVAVALAVAAVSAIPADETPRARPSRLAPAQPATRPVTFPFEFYRNAIWFEARLNGSHPVRVQLDTAASSCVLAQRVADDLGLPVLRQFDQPNAGSGDNPTRITIRPAVTLDFPGGSLEFPQIATVPLDEVSRTYGTRIDAIVGFPLLARDIVTIDFDRRTITMSDPAAFAYQGSGTVLALEGGPDVREPIVRARVVVPGADPIEGRFLVDEPHPHCLLFATPFSQAHGLPSAAERTAGRLVQGHATGVGGRTPYVVGRIEGLQLGGELVKRPTAAFAHSKAGAFARTDIAGIIGGEILRRFRLILDFPNRRMILERGQAFDEPYDWDASGLKLRTASGDFHRFEVTGVAEATPAAEAGLRIGDWIAAINGRPASQWTLWDVELLLKKAGHTHALEVERSGTALKLTLKTRTLL